MSRWSARWGWTERVELYDADLDRQVRLEFVQAQIEARERHAQVASATLATLTAPVHAMLDALQDPKVLERLILDARASSNGFMALLRVIARCASVIPAIVAMERLSLGMSEELIQTEDKTESSLADRIVGDAVAIDLAIALLDRLVSGNSANDPN
jgi:hypothetical protein